MPVVKPYPLPETQYYKFAFNKKQIYLHHTVSGDGAANDINYWKSTPEHVATCVVVERGGDIYQCFDENYWAYHLGIDSAHTAKFKQPTVPQPNDTLNKYSIGIEIDSWGGLVKNGAGQWCVPKYDANLKKNIATNIIIPNDKVIVYPQPFRGWEAFEKYTPQQIESVKYLLTTWCEKYKIPKTYNSDIWDISKRAYNGDSGIFAHTSVRTDKSDAHPQPELIDMLKNL